MKRIIIAATVMLAVTALAIVSPGKPQKITVLRDAKHKLVFNVDDGKSFANVDPCAKHCYRRSWFTNEKSEWANLVNVLVETLMSAEDRQYIGDRFVANKVYPHDIVWVEGGKTNMVVYRPDKKSIRKRRKLK